MWLLMEVLSGSLLGHSSGVAHWAHVGGFIFGAVVALGLRHSGLEHKTNAAIEAKVTWTADAGIVQATEQMEHGKLDEAIATLQGYVATKPDSVEAYTLLQQVFWRKNDIPAYQNAIIKLCQLHLKAQNVEEALHDFDEYTNSGGAAMPAGSWLELCRLLEGQQKYDRAVTEYEHLAKAYPAEKQSLRRFSRPDDSRSSSSTAPPMLCYITRLPRFLKCRISIGKQTSRRVSKRQKKLWAPRSHPLRNRSLTLS